MNVITAINNEKIYNKLKQIKNIKLIYNDIQYKEGILELLENKKIIINYIIINEELKGQININELINKILKINNKIKIIIITNNKLNKKNRKNIQYYLFNEFNFEKIINKKNNIIGVIGNKGSGKTINIFIMAEILSKNNKILIVDLNNENIIKKIYKKEKNNNKIIKINNNLFLYNNLEEKPFNYNEIIKIKNNYDYIFIELEEFKILKIINKYILIINPNLLELIKLKNKINFNNKLINFNIILNKYNINSISEKIIKKIINNKNNILKIPDKKIIFMINNNFNISFLSKKYIKNYKKFIKNLI